MAGYDPPYDEYRTVRYYLVRPEQSFHDERNDERRPVQGERRPVQGNRVSMAAQQFSYPPPPPPPPGPPPANHQQPHPQYGYAQQQQPPQYQQAQRGGGPPRGGRGGAQGGRGDFHGNAPYNPQNPSAGFNAHQGPTQYNGPNGQQPPAPYIGPQAPGPQGQQGPNYGGPQWQNDQHNQQHGPGPQQHGPQQHGPQHHGPPQHGHVPGPQQHGPPHHNPAQQHQPPMHHGPPAAPLQAQNYHPNYAPQTFQPQQPYGPQPPQTFQPAQPPYNHGPPAQHGPPQWNGPPQQNRPPFNNNNRGRGGFNGGRGGHEAPLMGPPIRMGFDNERGGGHMAQASNGFPQQYPNHTPPPPYTQPSYQGFPPQDFSGGQRPPLDPNPYTSPNRGRGGHNNFRGRGRGDFQQFRGRGDGRHHNNNNHNGGHRATSDNFHKPAVADANGKKKKKRRTNTLGLTPNGVDHEESEDEVDDADEEARLVTLLGPDTPQLPTDLDAWLAERRSKYPTKARRDAAAEELRQRREQNRQKRQNDQHSDKTVKKEEGDTALEKQQRKAEKLRLELEKTQRKIQEQMSGGSKRKREDGDEGDNDRGQVSEAGSNGLSGSESEEDMKPETLSSRHHVPFRVQQAPKAQLQRHCKYFSTGGTCGKKGKCRFVHDQEVRNQALRDKEANGGKMTLAQRLILNDTAKDDLTILKSIKYLKEKGLMSEQLTGSVPNQDDYKEEENGYAENLNYGDN